MKLTIPSKEGSGSQKMTKIGLPFNLGRCNPSSIPIPIGSMYGIFTNKFYHRFKPFM